MVSSERSLSLPFLTEDRRKFCLRYRRLRFPLLDLFISFDLSSACFLLSGFTVTSHQLRRGYWNLDLRRYQWLKLVFRFLERHCHPPQQTNFKEGFDFGEHKLLDIIFYVDGDIIAKMIREFYWYIVRL